MHISTSYPCGCRVVWLRKGAVDYVSELHYCNRHTQVDGNIVLQVQLDKVASQLMAVAVSSGKAVEQHGKTVRGHRDLGPTGHDRCPGGG